MVSIYATECLGGCVFPLRFILLFNITFRVNVDHDAVDGGPIYLCAGRLGHGPSSAHRGHGNVFYHGLFGNDHLCRANLVVIVRLYRVSLDETVHLDHENHVVVSDDLFFENHDYRASSIIGISFN